MSDDTKISDILFHPRREKREPTLPPKGLLFVNPREAAEAHRQVIAGGGEKLFLFQSGLTLSADRRSFVAGPCVGAPLAALVLEKLIACGARSVLMVGWCGSMEQGLCIGDILLPDAALCGEGTSQYYRKPGFPEQASPDAGLVKGVQELLGREGLTTQNGAVWSTDAPYRESRAVLQKLRDEEGLAGVDMEFSALCSVAAFRDVTFAAVMLVSDELFRAEWVPGFGHKKFRELSASVPGLLVEKRKMLP